MLFLSYKNHAGVIEAFNFTSRYLDELIVLIPDLCTLTFFAKYQIKVRYIPLNISLIKKRIFDNEAPSFRL